MPKSKQFHLTLPKETAEKVEKYAKINHSNPSAYMRQIICWYLEEPELDAFIEYKNDEPDMFEKKE